MVPYAGIEPALLSKPDFESGASTNSANRAMSLSKWTMPDYTKSHRVVNPFCALFPAKYDATHCRSGQTADIYLQRR